MLKFIVYSVASIVLLSACAQPSVRQPTSEELAAFSTASREAEIRELDRELAAIQRKGDILRQTNQYQPFVKIVNIYIEGKQAGNGSYTHPRVVSVPLIFRQETIQYSDAAIAAMFGTANKTPETDVSGVPADAQTLNNPSTNK